MFYVVAVVVVAVAGCFRNFFVDVDLFERKKK